MKNLVKMKMSKRDRVRAQVKSRWYYAFWGTATVAVVANRSYCYGKVYVMV